MSDTYKVRMTVLVVMSGYDPDVVKVEAKELAEDAGFTVLSVEEPSRTPIRSRYDAPEGDIYP